VPDICDYIIMIKMIVTLLITGFVLFWLVKITIILGMAILLVNGG